MSKEDSKKITEFVRNPMRQLPDGSIARVFPFHVSLEGLESRVLCRDREDYDVFVKSIAVCARRENVILVTYSVVSNHAHNVVLASSKKDADNFGEEVKRMYAMYFRRKYDDSGVMRGTNVNSQWLDTDWYLRNAIAYDIRNALDNGAVSVQEYEWTSYKAYFTGRKTKEQFPARNVNSLTKAEKRAIMHTNDSLNDVRWLVDNNRELIPWSICDYRYVEAAFGGSPTSFLQKIGIVNLAEMQEKLITNPRKFRKDEEVMRSVNEICTRWFSCGIHNLPLDKKCRLLPYYFRSNRTNTAQMARIFELSQETVSDILKKNGL